MTRLRSFALATLAVLAAIAAVVQTVRIEDAHRLTRNAKSALTTSEATRGKLTNALDKALSELSSARRSLDQARVDTPQGTIFFGDATPVVQKPDGVPLCRPDQVEVASPEPTFLRLFNRSGHGCALLDYPTVVGVVGGNRFVVLTYQLAAPGYTDGPPWSGIFDPKLTAVLSIRTPEPDANGRCTTGRAETASVSDLQLFLAGQTSPLPLRNVVLEVGPCRPAISTFAYDSTDN